MDDRRRRGRRSRIGGLGLLALGLTLALPPYPAAAADAGLIEIRAPAPADPDQLARMRSWHARYHRAIEPLREPLEALLKGLRARRFAGLGQACEGFAAALGGLDEEALLPVPDFATGVHLEEALDRLDRAAAACRAERRIELAYQLDEARRAFGNAALALRRFGLAP